MDRRSIPRLLSTTAGVALLLAGASAAGAQIVLQELSGSLDGFGHELDGGADVDGDGVPDLLVADGADFPSLVHVFSGAGGSTLATFDVNGSRALAVAFVGDVDLDGVVDLALGETAASRYTVHSGADGRALFGDDADIDYFAGAVEAAGDVDADGVPDLVVGSRADGLLDVGGDTLRVVSGAGGSTIHELSFFDPFDFPITFAWTVAGVGDLDDDGHADLAVGVPLHATGPGDGYVEVLSGADLSLLHLLVVDDVPGDRFGLRVTGLGDVDGDGVPDLAASTGSNAGQVRLFSGRSGALLSLLAPPERPVHPAAIDLDAIGDLDGDGVPDLAAGFAGVLRVFSPATSAVLFDVPGYEPGSVNWSPSLAVAGAGDVDGDGRADIVVGAPRQPQEMADGLVQVVSGVAAPFTPTGSGVPGVDGIPALAGMGTLQPGSSGKLVFRNGAPNALSFLVIGFDELGAPFHGGTFVPTLDVLVVLVTDAAGNWTASWPAWPAGLPSYTHLWLQAFTQDAAAPGGLSATEGSHLVTP